MRFQSSLKGSLSVDSQSFVKIRGGWQSYRPACCAGIRARSQLALAG